MKSTALSCHIGSSTVNVYFRASDAGSLHYLKHLIGWVMNSYTEKRNSLSSFVHSMPRVYQIFSIGH